MEHDAKGKVALLAAVSALGLSLGVTLAAPADARPTSVEKPKSKQLKIDNQKGGSGQVKGQSAQVKSISWGRDRTGNSTQIKGESTQLKYDSHQIKGESTQQKGQSNQLKLDGVTPK